MTQRVQNVLCKESDCELDPRKGAREKHRERSCEDLGFVPVSYHGGLAAGSAAAGKLKLTGSAVVYRLTVAR